MSDRLRRCRTGAASLRRSRVTRARRMRLAAAFTLMAVSGLVWNSFALFLVALQAEFGWSRAAISGAFGAFALTNALSAPLLGYAMSRWDSRRILAGLSLLLGSALVGTAFVSRIETYWLVFGILGGLGAQGFSSFAIFAVLAGRFRERPATAMAVADSGSGLATFLGLPLVQAVVDGLGWRGAYLMLGATVAVVGAGLHLFGLDRVRPATPTTNRPAGAGTAGFAPGLALLTMAGSYLCGSAAYQGLLTQQVAFFEDRGIGADRGVWIAAAGGLVIFSWRILSGLLSDRWGPAQAMIIAATGSAVTFAVLAAIVAGAHPSMLIVYPVALGVAFGGQQVLLAIGTRHVTSPRRFPVALSFCRLASGIGMAAGPVAAGLVHDVTGRDSVAIALLAALAALHFAGFAAAMRIRGISGG